MKSVKLSSLTDAEILNIKKEIGQDIAALAAKINAKRDPNSKLALALASRNARPGHIVVTDHAVVRYLERVCGFNTEAIREALRLVLQQSRLGDGETDRFINDKFGMILAYRNGAISTVMTPLEHDIVSGATAIEIDEPIMSSDEAQAIFKE